MMEAVWHIRTIPEERRQLTLHEARGAGAPSRSWRGWRNAAGWSLRRCSWAAGFNRQLGDAIPGLEIGKLAEGELLRSEAGDEAGGGPCVAGRFRGARRGSRTGRLCLCIGRYSDVIRRSTG